MLPSYGTCHGRVETARACALSCHSTTRPVGQSPELCVAALGRGEWRPSESESCTSWQANRTCPNAGARPAKPPRPGAGHRAALF